MVKETTTVKVGLLLLSFVIFCPQRGEATEPAGCALIPSHHAFYKVERPIIEMPSHLTFVQRSYLNVVCWFLNELEAQAKVEEVMIEGLPLEIEVERRLPLESRKSPEILSVMEQLYPLRKQLSTMNSDHVKALTKLIKQALAAQAFDEEAFWKAWWDEENRYEDASRSLREKVGKFMVQLQDAERRHIRSGSKEAGPLK